LITEIRDELKLFLNTRLQMIRSELHENLTAAKVIVPMVAIVAVLLGTAFLLFSAALVVLVASAFAGDTYAWFYGLIIISFLWMVLGAVTAFFAYNEFRAKGIFPKRTIEVLKADKDWIQSEARIDHGRAA
jgi:energy-coupling factor transporter transmembrane protein EcfT